MQTLANNPNLGLTISEVSTNAFRFSDGYHVFYYLKRENDVVFVGVLSSHLAPNEHLAREQEIGSELRSL